MPSALSRAAALCHARRLRKTATEAPLSAATVSVLVVLGPLALHRAGRTVGDALADAVRVDGVAEALVLGPALAAAVAGAAVAVSLPGRSALGQQVAAGPCGGIVVIVAGLLVPALVVAVAVLPSLLAVCLTVAARLPGGWVAGLALVCATIAAVAAGAVVAEGGIAAARGRPRRALAIAGGAFVWAITGAVSGSAPLGPLAPVGAALRGSGSGWFALAGSCGTAVALALAWVVLAATRPEKGIRRARRGRSLGRGSRCHVPGAVTVLLARRDDVRRASVGALGFGAAGTAVAAAAATPAPAAFLLATTTALLGSVVWPLALGGVLLRGRWLWAGAPADRRLIAASACGVALTGSAVPVAVVGVGAASAAGASWSSVGAVAAFVIVGSASALLAGALVPWSGEGVGDQLTTFAALAAVVIAVSLAVGLAAPRLVALGLPDIGVAALLCTTSLGVGCHALGRKVGSAA